MTVNNTAMWRAVVCTEPIVTDTNTAFVKLQEPDGNKVVISGIKAYGQANPGKPKSAPGTVVALAIGKTGVPYAVNNKGHIFSKPLGGSWGYVSPGGQNADA
jgi:hypothetical protein